MRKHAHRIRQTGKCHFQRERHLPLDLFRGAAGEQRNDGHLRVGDIGKRLDRQLLEGKDAAADKQHRAENHE